MQIVNHPLQCSHKLPEEEEWHGVSNQKSIIDGILEKYISTNFVSLANLKQGNVSACQSVRQTGKINSQWNAYYDGMAPKISIFEKKKN